MINLPDKKTAVLTWIRLYLVLVALAVIPIELGAKFGIWPVLLFFFLQWQILNVSSTISTVRERTNVATQVIDFNFKTLTQAVSLQSERIGKVYAALQPTATPKWKNETLH